MNTTINYPYENLDTFILPKLLDRSIELYGELDSFGFVGEKAFTYNEFGRRIKALTELLISNGITKGDKVVLLSENMPNWGVAYFAITYFGAVVVPVLPDFHPSDVRHILKHSEAKAAIVSDKHISTIEDDTDSDLKFVVSLEKLSLIDELSNKSYLSQIKQKISSSKIPVPNEDDLCSILYTSGTTGNSKGVMLSHKNLVTNSMSVFPKVNILETDVWLSILPLAHTFECTVGLIVPTLHGSSVYYVDKVPTPSVLLKALDIIKPTIMLSVPLIIEKIYKNKVLAKFNSSIITKYLYKISFFRKILNKIAGKKLYETFGARMKLFAVGGAGLSPIVEQFLLEADFPYIVGYGLTETAPLLAGGSVLGDEKKIKSTGTAFYGVELKIKNPDKETGEGEIIARSPSIMMGYYKDEKQTAEVMENGWFLTGDLGHIDEDGYLFISGRSKNVIIGPAGENIYPEQIEAIINNEETVLDSLVMEDDNSKVIARIHLDLEMIDSMFDAHKVPDKEVAELITKHLEDMRVDINSQLSSFSRITKFIHQIEPFTKTPTKKIKRYLYKI